LTCIRRAPYSEERYHDAERGYREPEKYKFCLGIQTLFEPWPSKPTLPPLIFASDLWQSALRFPLPWSLDW
jgi:hypothetical protein